MRLRALIVAVACVAAGTGCGPGVRSSAPPPAPAPHLPPPGPSTGPAPRPEPEPPGNGRPPTPAERAAIDRLVRATARVRELTLLRPVPVEIQDESRITEELLSQLDADELREAQELYTALGLLEPGLDLLELLTSVLAEQVVGFYDPEEGRLVVRDDVIQGLESRGEGPELDEARVVLVHELVHALQDQLLGLGERYEDEREADEDNAFRSVVEGDATLAMLGFIIEQQGGTLDMMVDAPGGLGTLLDDAGPLPGDLLARAPAIVRVSLVAPYLRGAVFCSDLYRDGGWAAVNGAHLEPPRSMEQVLHYAKYVEDERPDPVTLPPLPVLASAGYRPGAEDTLGELELAVYLGQGLPEGIDSASAAGWSGDRARAYRTEAGDWALVWYTSWDDRSAAQRVERRALQLLRSLPPEARARHRVERRGRAVLVLRALPPEVHGSIVEVFERFARDLPRRPPRGPARRPSAPVPP